MPPYEATLTTNLREAGAVILAKTVMTELANYTASGMPGNYSALGGFGLNPYDPRRDPRAGTNDGRPVMGTGGSSSGIGTASSFWAANVGTETSGSILSPSNANMLAGIKPTVGRVSRWGVIPITADQDTAGPMARTVTDAAIMLGALEGSAPDPNDPATSRCEPPPGRDYAVFLRRDGLQGARIGIPRALYYDPVTAPGSDEPQSRLSEAGRSVMAEAIAVLEQEGATIVDPADIPSVVDPDPRRQPALEHREQRARVRHEARLQCLARDPGRHRPRRDADGGSASGTWLTSRRVRSSTGRPDSTAPTRSTWRRTAPSTRPTARGTSI